MHKYGGLGYVGFAEEVRAQEAEFGFGFDYIVVCVVTGSTQAGMIVGFAKDGRRGTRDRHRRLRHAGADHEPKCARSRDNTAELVELGRDVADDEMVIVEDYAYPAYGVPSEETKRGDPARRADRGDDHGPGL